MASIRSSARTYEAWLKAAVGRDFVADDLKTKHSKMRTNAFTFLRATYWRWAEIVLDVCPEVAEAPQLLAIGDTHIENFGTWRDVEGRLIWGANDFDEAAVMPYPLDLVRLAASALLARGPGDASGADMCDAILAGYDRGLSEPAPIVLERDHKWLRKTVLLPERERTKFWAKFELEKGARVPMRYRRSLRSALPDPVACFVAAPRTAGTGSLGRPRFVARSEWKGGPVVREAKALVMSAWSLCFTPNTAVVRAADIATGRFRAPDPHYRVADSIVVRRLSPNSRKIEVKHDGARLVSPDMLELMGLEIANCHADNPALLPALRDDLLRREPGWLHDAASAAARATTCDYEAF